jgi:heparin/heparan-sulfate lyase
MLLPKPADRTMAILSGRDANSVADRYFEPPKPDRPEANGHRILFSPKLHRTDDTFLTVLSMCDGETPPPPVGLKTLSDVFVLSIADRTVVLSRDGKLIETSIQFEVTGNAPREVLVAGLAPGRWSVLGNGNKVRQTADVESRRNTAFLVLPRGRYTMRPE